MSFFISAGITKNKEKTIKYIQNDKK